MIGTKSGVCAMRPKTPSAPGSLNRFPPGFVTAVMIRSSIASGSTNGMIASKASESEFEWTTSTIVTSTSTRAGGTSSSATSSLTMSIVSGCA